MSGKVLCSCGGLKKREAASCFACFQIRRLAKPRRRRPTVDRFWPKVNKTPTCWLWTGATNGRGYGRFSITDLTVKGGARWLGAHRFAYELLVGPIPGGLVLDHLCGNERCVNPAHLEPVTQTENVRRAALGRDGRGRFRSAA